MRRLKVSKLAAAVSLFASRSVGSALFALRGRRGMLINVKIVCSPSLSLSRCLNLSFLLLSLPCSLWGQMKVVPFCYLQCQHRYPHERSPATEQNRRDALNISVNSKQMHPHTRVQSSSFFSPLGFLGSLKQTTPPPPPNVSDRAESGSSPTFLNNFKLFFLS